MTAIEVAQLRSDRGFWRRKAEALERRYAPLRGRAFLAITAECRGRRWVGETHFVDGSSGQVRARNYLLDLERRIVEAHCENEPAEEGRHGRG